MRRGTIISLLASIAAFFGVYLTFVNDGFCGDIFHGTQCATELAMRSPITIGLGVVAAIVVLVVGLLISTIVSLNTEGKEK
jgi:hypothetical protein